MTITKNEFAKYSELGIGRAFQADIESTRFDHQIYNLMVYNYSYDVQSEGSREWYAYEILIRSRNRVKIIDRFVEYFDSFSINLYSGHIYHIFSVSFILYRNNFLDKNKIIENYLRINDYKNNELLGGYFILELGEDGVNKYLDLIGKSIKYSNENSGLAPDWEFEVNIIKNKIAKYRITNSDNKNIQTAINYFNDFKKIEFDKMVNTFESIDDYLFYIKSNKLRGRHKVFYEELSENDLVKCFDLISIDSSDDELYGLLSPFEYRNFPGEYKFLLRFFDRDNKRVRLIVSKILSKIKSKKVRKSALHYLRKGISIAESIRMLGSSMNDNDDEEILNAMKLTADKDDLHEIGYSLLAVSNLVETNKIFKSLKFYYENSSCGICRYKIVEALDENNLLNDEWKNELIFDSYCKTRNRYGNMKDLTLDVN